LANASARLVGGHFYETQPFLKDWVNCSNVVSVSYSLLLSPATLVNSSISPSIYTTSASHTPSHWLSYVGVSIKRHVSRLVPIVGVLTHCCCLKLAWNCVLGSSQVPSNTDKALSEDKEPAQTQWLCRTPRSARYITGLLECLSMLSLHQDPKARFDNAANFTKPEELRQQTRELNSKHPNNA